MMLGYADSSTTQIYTQVSIEKPQDSYTTTLPARLSKRESEGENGD